MLRAKQYAHLQTSHVNQCCVQNIMHTCRHLIERFDYTRTYKMGNFDVTGHSSITPVGLQISPTLDNALAR
jgi:hypothetical protein